MILGCWDHARADAVRRAQMWDVDLFLDAVAQQRTVPMVEQVG